MTIFPFAAWKPDLPAIGEHATVATGVVPVTETSYGPVGTLSTTTSALTARNQGSASFLDSSNNVHIFAGDATKLYKLGTTTWSDVSIGGGYSIASDATWKFTLASLNGLNRVIACGDINTNVQSYTLGVSALFGNLSATAPRAKCCAMMYPSFLVLANTWDSTDGFVANRIWWANAEDPTDWQVPGSAAAQAVQSDNRDLIFGGPIIAITGPIGGAVAGLVFSRRAIHRVIYAGPPTVLDFFAISQDMGTPCENAVIAVRGLCFFLSDDGFYATDGNSLNPIGTQQVDSWFWSRVDQNYLNRVFAAADPSRKLVYWAFPDSNASSGLPNQILAYNYELGRWSLAVENSSIEGLLRSHGVGYTLDQLDPFGTMETLPYSLDSPNWQGGRPVLAAFDSSHKYGALNGANSAATMETAELPGADGRRWLVNGIRPFIDGASGNITAAVGYRETPYGTVNYTSATSVGGNGICPQHREARYVRARVSVAAAQTWTHAMGIEPVMQPGGER